MTIPAWLRWLMAGAIVCLVTVVPVVRYRWVYRNAKRLREITPGLVYRSGWMSAPGFTDAVRRYGIRTVINLIRKFMIYIGPISSIFDFLTFFIMLQVFHAGPVLFHTGWFVESLCTQTLVVFIVRTAGNPLRSRPSTPLVVTVLLVVAIGILLPYTPLAVPLGFTPLPGLYFLFLIAMTVTYLLLVELVKRPLLRRYAQ